jgi:long-chain fatty acid transport protein
VVTGSSALTVSANGFRLASQDAFATARGEAFVATADNPSAIYYNPAGITQLEGNNLRGGFYGLHFDPSYTPPPPTDTNTGSKTFHSQDQEAVVPQFFFTSTPKDLPLSFGLGLYSPFGASVNWPTRAGFRAIGKESSLTYVTANPVVALKVTPNLSVAAGAMVSYGDLDLQQGLTDSTNSLFRLIWACSGKSRTR